MRSASSRRRDRSGLVVLLVALLLVLGCGGLAKPRRAPEGTPQPDVLLSKAGKIAGPEIAFLEDPDDTLTLEDVRSRAAHPYVRGVPHFGYSRSTWWFRVKLLNDTPEPQQRTLAIGWPRLNDIDFYFLRDGAEPIHRRSGWLVPFTERDLPSPIPDFPLELDAGERATVWIRVASESELYLPLELRTSSQREWEELLSTLFSFLYYGVLVGLGLYNLVLAFRLRRAHYWLYVGQVFFFVTYMLVASGYVGLLSPLLPLGASSVPILSWGWVMLHVAFARSFIDTPRFAPKLDHFLRLNLWIVVPLAMLLSATVVDQRQADTWFGPLLPLNLLSVLVAAILCARGGSATARWYVVAQAPLALGFLLGSLAFTGVLPVPPVMAGAMIFVGTMAELVVLSVALSEHMRLLAEQQANAMRELQAGRLASLRKLVASVTHELNSPLGSLNSSMDSLARVPQIVEESESGSERQRRALSALPVAVTTAQQASERISRVVESLKQFAGLDSSERQPFDVHRGLDGALELLHGRLAPGIQVEKDYGVVPKVQGYPAQFNQALLHLLSNAIEAMSEGGRLRISTRADERAVTLKIEDTGTGIEAHRLENLFLPVLSRAGERVHMGLGLPTSRRIVEDHGGTLDLASAAGKGTVARITLPIP